VDRAGAAVVDFGRFRVDRRRRKLLADGQPVELGGRAFDTLVVLLDGGGAVVSKDELMRRSGPRRRDNNLEIQISTLRKVLGADRDLIRTVVGRGYQFTGAIRDTPSRGRSPRSRGAEVETTNSGEVRVRRIVCAVDCGTVTASQAAPLAGARAHYAVGGAGVCMLHSNLSGGRMS
jgi:DNA-binding winged helix-turn-helix (wHTH) protein